VEVEEILMFLEQLDHRDILVEEVCRVVRLLVSLLVVVVVV
jgi:hypothetical protein